MLPNQTFFLKMKFGEDLCALYPTTDKILKFNGNEITVIPARHGEKTIIPYCEEAPCESTLMLMPPDNDTPYYLSLNMFLNSLRFPEDQHLIQTDYRLDEILVNSMKNKDLNKAHSLPIAMQIADYCFALLARPILTKMKEPITKEDNQANPQKLRDIFKDILKINFEFLAALSQHLNAINHNEKHVQYTITPEEYKKYHKYSYKYFHKHYEKQKEDYAIGKFWKMISDQIDDEEEFDDENLDKKIGVLFNDTIPPILPKGEILLDYLGVTHAIIKSCMSKYDDKEHSGHMTIIRMISHKGIKHGNKMKQSLCIARHISGEHGLEIIQDYDSTTTLGNVTKLNNHMEVAIEDAKKMKNPCSLRILKKIQVDKCQEKDSHGMLKCFCTKYSVNESNSYDLKCSTCGHIHRTFESYSDLIGLPCLLILVNNGKMGDTFPPSLAIMDDRINNIKINNTHGLAPYLTNWVQEKGRLCRYTKRGDTLPIIYISVKLKDELFKVLKKYCSYYHYFVARKSIDAKVKYDEKTFKMKLKGDHFDKIKDNKPHDNHFLLIAEPQCGKTGVYLHVISLLRALIEGQDIEIDETEEVGEEADNENDFIESWDPFQAIVPHFSILLKLKMPIRVSNSKHTRLTGPYNYPVDRPPECPNLISKQPKKITLAKQENSLCTHPHHHSDEMCCKVLNQRNITFNIPIMGIDEITINFPSLSHYANLFDFNLENDDVIYIMTPSSERCLTARLNWNHLFIKDGRIVPFVHLVFVQKEEYEEYVKHWGNHVGIVQLPEEMNDIRETVSNGGIGYARRFIQRFCHEMGIKGFYMADDTIIYLKKVLEINGRPKCISMLELHEDFKKIGSVTSPLPIHLGNYEKHPDVPEANSVASYSGPLNTFALIGPRKKRTIQYAIKTFHSKRHVSSFFWMNNDLLVQQGLFFEPWNAWEDLKLSNDADDKGLHVVKVNSFEFTNIHAKDQCLLYEWHEDDYNTKNGIIPSVDAKKAGNILYRYLKSNRIQCVIGSFNNEDDADLEDKIKSLKTVHYGGSVVVLINDVKEARLAREKNDCNHFTFVLRLTPQQYVHFRNSKHLKNCISNQLVYSIEFDAILSTHKPLVTHDFMVLQVTKQPQKAIKNPIAEDDFVISVPVESNEESKLSLDEMNHILLKTLLKKVEEGNNTTNLLRAELAETKAEVKNVKDQLEKMSEENQNLKRNINVLLDQKEDRVSTITISSGDEADEQSAQETANEVEDIEDVSEDDVTFSPETKRRRLEYQSETSPQPSTSTSIQRETKRRLMGDPNKPFPKNKKIDLDAYKSHEDDENSQPESD